MRNKRFLVVFSSLLALSLGLFVPAGQAEEKTNSIGMEFVLIPAGSFTMGEDEDFDEHATSSEIPPHRVTISRPFYLGKYEVTQGQWVAVMGSNPSEFKGKSNPVEQVSWDDAQVFIKRLNQKEGTDKYRLPTEAEWEYANRAGTSNTYSFGDDAEQFGKYGWCWGNSGEKTHPVGQKQPNAWGLYDMHGNVWELVQDWFDEKYYSSSPSSDPRGPSSGSHRVVRGGGWGDLARYSLSARRHGFTPDFKRNDVGFRLALSAGQ